MVKGKVYTIEEALAEIRNSPPPPVVNKKLKKELIEILKDLMAAKFRKEALEILLKSDKTIIGEFLYYYYSDIENVACMVVDKAHDILLKKKILKKQSPNFGINAHIC
jgi:hypothetical protein